MRCPSAERVYESTKLAALFDMLRSQGHPAEEILRHVNVSVKDVHSPKTRISVKQLIIACKNAIQLLGDRHLPYRIGTSIHLSTYGMYGFAILCCPDFRNVPVTVEIGSRRRSPQATRLEVANRKPRARRSTP